MGSRTQPSQGLNPSEQSPRGQRVGYARVSTQAQNLDRQIGQLRAAGVDKIFSDHVTGAHTNRPELAHALEYLREGDTLVVTSMDRLARSLTDINNLVQQLTGRGVEVEFLAEGQTYTRTRNPLSTLMLGILGSVAEFERSIIRERQAEGIARAKERGVYKGRKPALTQGQVEQAREWVSQGVPKAEVARRLHIGRTTLYKYLGQPPNNPVPK